MSTMTARMDSPAGPMRLVSDGGALTQVMFAESVDESEPTGQHDPLLHEARCQLTAYFAGTRTDFDLPLELRGTEFQRRVWEQLRRIPFGATTSYGAIAARLGMRPGAARAVGLANGANPIAIVVPCHRVIGANGTLIGYAGGLPRKRFLLALEAPTAQAGLFDA